jgi:hypothetical protein
MINLPPIFTPIVLFAAKSSEITQSIQTCNTYQSVNDSGHYCHITKNYSYKVESQEADKTPVDGADDNKRQCDII